MSLVRTTPKARPMKRELITKLHATLEKLVHKRPPPAPSSGSPAICRKCSATSAGRTSRR